MKFFKTLLICSVLFAAGQTMAGQQKGYYRYPAIHGDEIIFTAEGDLWKYNIMNQQIARLTTSHGVESHASISPDGSRVAFTGQYEGPSEVYVMPVTGGTPKRLTFEEGSPIVYQWTPDGRILYSTNTFSSIPDAQLVKLNPDNLVTERVPLSQADQGTYSPSGVLFFTRLRDQGCIKSSIEQTGT